MKKLLLAFALSPLFAAPALASDDPVECAKKEGVVHCEVKKDKVVVDAISVNGGDCDVPPNNKVLHKAYRKGDKFNVPEMGASDIPPGFDDCSYVRIVTIKMRGGQKKTFNAL